MGWTGSSISAGAVEEVQFQEDSRELFIRRTQVAGRQEDLFLA